MEQLNNLNDQLGLMAWPLLLCSAITITIICERLVQVALCTGVGHRKLRKILSVQDPNNQPQLDQIVQEFSSQRPLLFKGAAMLISHRKFDKALREDAASIWLQEKRHQLHAGLKLLTLIGVISPLLGLLGTVLGLIDMFKGVAATTGAITPNDLADGLGLAMKTTAAGLIIALPAISGAQLLGLWADKITNKLEHSLNQCNLWLEGISITNHTGELANTPSTSESPLQGSTV